MLADTYIFYADTYFIQNFVVKLGILMLTIRTLKTQMRKPVVKILGIASVATMLEIIGLFLFPSYRLFLLFVHIIEVPSMMMVLLWKRRELVGKSIILGYFYTIFINGVIELLWNMVGEESVYLLLVLTGNGICVFAITYAFHRWKITKGVYYVEVHFLDIVWPVKGFYDSGNHLKDPYTGKGVHIISEEVASRLKLLQREKVCIPYQSIGNEDGIIDVYYVDEVRIQKQEGVTVQKSVPLGVVDNTIFKGKKFEMIINEDVW